MVDGQLLLFCVLHSRLAHYAYLGAVSSATNICSATSQGKRRLFTLILWSAALATATVIRCCCTISAMSQTVLFTSTCSVSGVGASGGPSSLMAVRAAGNYAAQSFRRLLLDPLVDFLTLESPRSTDFEGGNLLRRR